MNLLAGKRKIGRIVFLLAFIPLIFGLGGFGYFTYKIWRVSNVITEEVKPADTAEAPAEEKSYRMITMPWNYKLPEKGEEERINILLLGRATPAYPGSNLTDTIILASINPKTYQSAMLSIPRDLYVRIPDTKRYTKINAVYSYGLKTDHQKGIELLEDTVEDITGQPVHYYVMVNFDAFSKAVDLIGGVEVEVDQDIYDDRYPAPGYAYTTFKIDKGRHHLDGETALKYVRVRHNAGGDFGRARRQQQVLEAMKEEFFAKRGIIEGWKFFDEVLKVVQENVKTDISFKDYLPFMVLAGNVNIHQTTNKVLDQTNEGLLEAYRPRMGRVIAYTLRPRAGNYYEIRRVARNIFDLEKIKRQENAVSGENAKVAVYAAPNLSSYTSRVKSILKEKGYDTVDEDMNYTRVQVWQRPLKARLPELTTENRSVSSESLIEKKEVAVNSLDKTVIYDNAQGSKPFSLEDIADRLNAQVSLYRDFDSKIDFAVILGENIKEVMREEKEGEFFLTEEGLKQEEMEVHED